jgi:hypothetical protein
MNDKAISQVPPRDGGLRTRPAALAGYDLDACPTYAALVNDLAHAEASDVRTKVNALAAHLAQCAVCSAPVPLGGESRSKQAPRSELLGRVGSWLNRFPALLGVPLGIEGDSRRLFFFAGVIVALFFGGVAVMALPQIITGFRQGDPDWGSALKIGLISPATILAAFLTAGWVLDLTRAAQYRLAAGILRGAAVVGALGAAFAMNVALYGEQTWRSLLWIPPAASIAGGLAGAILYVTDRYGGVGRPFDFKRRR